MGINSQLIIGLVRKVFELLETSQATSIPKRQTVQENIESHVKRVLNWSRHVQFYGMGDEEDTDGSTIGLNLSSVPRKFGDGLRRKEKEINEDDLISNSDHFLLLGDPGSGKTTTVMRLARRIILKERTSDAGPWQVALVFRLREHDKDIPLFNIIADEIGVTYEERPTREEVRKEERHGRTSKQTYHVGNKHLHEFICQYLDDISCVLILDGLDEVEADSRRRIEDSIQAIIHQTTACKIIATCRSGDYKRQIPGIKVYEICPLDEKQVAEIAGRWIEKPERFLAEIRELPYHDLVNRPLFLCQLIVLYRNIGYLPDRPIIVYEKIARLCLEDWDAQRKVLRQSMYARFFPDQKMKFLSALSYHLTYAVRAKRFSHQQLTRAYNAISPQFRLPSEEVTMVARELESHTGILVETGVGYFEFSHLSLQEYLCAEYLVREPYSKHLISYLSDYPAPVAIAVCLAAEPNIWFASLFLREISSHNIGVGSISSFLRRLVTERPYFSSHTHLGFAILYLIFTFGDELTDALVEFIKIDNAKDALLGALSHYRVVGKVDSEKSIDVYLFNKPQEYCDYGYGFKLPAHGRISNDVYSRLKLVLTSQ